MSFSTSVLLAAESAAKFLSVALELASSVGLPVTSWRPGDPTRTLLQYLADQLETRDSVLARYAASAFLEEAEAEWLEIVAEQVYGVEVPSATFASSTITLINGGGGYFEFNGPGELIVRSSSSGKTYHTTSTGVLNSGIGNTLQLTVVADEAGTDSSAAVDEIDEVVSPPLPSVTITASTAASAVDKPTDEDIRILCRATRGALSPNGPADAYAYVCLTSSLTGVTDITRAEFSGDNATGTVTGYVAGPSGPVDSASVTAAQSAIERWATPLCITPTVNNSTAQVVPLTATVNGEEIPSNIQTLVSDAYAPLLRTVRIGGRLSRSSLFALVQQFLGPEDVVTIASPAADIDFSAGVVPTAGTVTVSEI